MVGRKPHIMKKGNLLSRKELRVILGGEDLRKLRNEVCLSQEYIAAQLRLAQSTYQRLESGEIKISLERLIKIAEIFEKPNEKVNSANQQFELLQTIITEQQRKIDELQNELTESKLLHHPNITTKMT